MIIIIIKFFFRGIYNFIEIAVASNSVWSDISLYLNGNISKSALHIFVHQGRHGMFDHLGITSNQNIKPSQQHLGNGKYNIIFQYLF